MTNVNIVQQGGFVAILLVMALGLVMADVKEREMFMYVREIVLIVLIHL